jgi:hypothetical protein
MATYETLLQPVLDDMGREAFRLMFESAIWVFGLNYVIPYPADDPPLDFDKKKWPKEFTKNKKGVCQPCTRPIGE